MSILTRTEIIAEARTRAGRKGQSVPLTIAFNSILQKMTRDYPLLRNICHPFTTVASKSFVALPIDYRSWEQCFYSTYELDWIEPEDYLYEIRIGTDTAAVPSKFTIIKDERRLYFWSKPSAAVAGYLYYSAIHPKAEKTLLFTSGGTYEVKPTDTVTGVTSAKTMVVNFVRLTSGSWAGGDAAGILLGTPSGAFTAAEVLKVGTVSLDVATVTADATSEDNFQHFLGEEFDEAVIEGVTWKCMELIADKSTQEKILVRDKRKDFESILQDCAGIKNRQQLRTGYRGF
jgi:hypothetical protein